MTKLLVHIDTPPVAKARPRVTMRGGKPRAYTPKKSADYEAAVAAACDAEAPLEGALRMHVNLYLPIPASWSKQKTIDAACGKILPTSRPDLDNYCKAIMDGLNGVAYEDDSQVVDLRVVKQYARKDTGARVMIEHVINRDQ